MSLRRLGLALTAIAGIAGCTTSRDEGGLLSGHFGPTAMTENDVRAFDETGTRPRRPNSAALRQAILSELDIGNLAITKAVPDEPPPIGAGGKKAAKKSEDSNGLAYDDGHTISPSQYTAAGYSYVYRMCSNYFDGLIKLQNQNGFNGDLVIASGSAVGTIMGLVRASAGSIGAIAATTGFASTAFNSFSSRALMTAYPVETKTLILTALIDYREKFPPDSVVDAPTAILNVQRFAEVCTYSGITRAAKQAIASAKVDVKTPANAEGTTLRAAISAKLGLSKELTPKQIAWLYKYVEDGKYKSVNDVLRIRAELPDGLQAQLKITAAGADEPTAVESSIGVLLKQVKSADTEVAAWIDSYPNDPKPAVPVAAPAPPVLPAAAAPAVALAPAAAPVKKAAPIVAKKPKAPDTKLVAANQEIARLKALLEKANDPAGGSAPPAATKYKPPVVPPENAGMVTYGSGSHITP